MIPCTKSVYPDGEHRLAFISFGNGETEWRCEDCGETITDYTDNHGC